MPLMGSFYVGVSGLQTSQNALNTTAHNLSNIETNGYVRQQVLLGDREYNSLGNAAVSEKQIGLGVEYSKVRQVRDAFLDKSYRKEASRSAFYDICYETSNEMETLLGELEGASFKNSLSNLWTSVEELKKDPTSAVVEGQFVTTSSQFLERAQAVYQGLMDYQDNLNSRVKDMVDQINEYGNKIHELNIAIKKVESGTEAANDLRDQRNLILDKLSALADITYREDVEGDVTVMLEGHTFVARDRVFEMSVGEPDKGTGFYTPIWPDSYNQNVFNLSEEISSDLDTDMGELKSLLLARGDRRANYTDLDETMYYDGGADPEDPTKELMPTSSSIVMNMQAELDNLVHSIATEINNILTGEKAQIDAGVTPQYTDKDDCQTELFVRLGTERYEEASPGVYKYVAEDSSVIHHADISSYYSIMNMKINPDLLKTPSILSFTLPDKQTDQVKADALAAAFDKEFGALNPNGTKEYKYVDYYDAMVGEASNSGFVYKSITENQSATVTALDNSRHQVTGVSSNEELTNMIKYQNAYNASSRYINTVDAMLAHILEKLG